MPREYREAKLLTKARWILEQIVDIIVDVVAGIVLYLILGGSISQRARIRKCYL